MAEFVISPKQVVEAQYLPEQACDGEKGEVKASGFKRYTYDLGFNTDVKPWLKANLKVSGTISEQVRSGMMLSDAASARPDLKAYNDDGTPYLHQYESYGQIYYVENPIIETMENTTTDNSNNLRMTANLEFKILPELKLFTQYTHNMRKSESYKYASSRTYEGSDYWGVYYDVNRSIYEEFNKAGIGFPFPQLTIHQAKD